MKCTWIAFALALGVLVQVSSNNEEDLTEEEQRTQASKDTDSPPPFVPPTKPTGDVYFAEPFNSEDEVWKTWVKSTAKKEGADSDVARYDGKWEIEALTTDGAIEEDTGLVLTEAAKHYAVAAKLDKPFTFADADAFVVQYEVNFQKGLSCGGAYIKLLTGDADLSLFHDKTPYSIMFGPDKCGLTSKIHFILRYKNPMTGEVEEKHSKQASGDMKFFDDKKTHLFTLLIRSDGVYHIILDQKPFLKGNLMDDLTPPIVPPKQIDDPDDQMPEDWDEREKIPDPNAVKPDDWDEDAPAKIPDPDAVKPEGWLDDGPETIPDPDATMPEDWDEEEDGEYEPPMIPNPACEKVGCGTWSAPMIQNPKYKGKWKPPLIDNEEYDGKWAPKKIDNPAYFEDDAPFYNLLPISAVGFELWSMSEKIFIDNLIVCGELTVANNYARDGWVPKMLRERAVGGAMSLGTYLDYFVELANTYPYMWALYAIALVLPFVICIGCCCMKAKPDEAARRKKTDEPSPDDPQEKEKEPTEVEPAGSTEEEKSFVAAADEDKEEEEARLTQSEEESQAEGSQAEDGGSQAEDGGSQAEDGGSQAEDGGSQAEDGGSQAEEEEEDGNLGDSGDVPAEEGSTKKRRKRKVRRED